MSYEDANGNSWNTLLDQEAHTFMVDLQAQLRFWKVAAENDPIFVSDLCEVEVGLAWSFRDMLARWTARQHEPAPNGLMPLAEVETVGITQVDRVREGAENLLRLLFADAVDKGEPPDVPDTTFGGDQGEAA